MAARVLVVEDEFIVAMDLRQQLEGMGHVPVGHAVSAAEALQAVSELAPDVVLMDIHIEGPKDGIETAAELQQRADVPVIYLTAHSDEATLQRAKITEPFGYLLKPVYDRELEVAIQIALYKHKTDRKLRQMERWLATTLSSIGDGVITVDLDQRVTYMNPLAQRLTGWTNAEACGRELSVVWPLVNEETMAAVELPVQRVLDEGVVLGLPPRTSMRTRTGDVVPVDDTLAPLRDDSGRVTGVVIVFRDVTAQRHAGHGAPATVPWTA